MFALVLNAYTMPSILDRSPTKWTWEMADPGSTMWTNYNPRDHS